MLNANVICYKKRFFFQNISNLFFLFFLFHSRRIEISKSIITASNQNKITIEKGPVMLLYELFTDISFSCMQTIGPQHAKFKTLVTVNGCDFEGTGKNCACFILKRYF